MNEDACALLEADDAALVLLAVDEDGFKFEVDDAADAMLLADDAPEAL